MTGLTTLRDVIQRYEEGQGLAEYALIRALIAVIVIGAVTLLGSNINQILQDVAAGI